MKTKITLMFLFITLFITTNANAIELDRTAMHTGEEDNQFILNDLLEYFFFDDGLYKDIVFYKMGEPKKYTVQEGDNLFRIALNHEVSLEELMAWNNKTNFVIHPGEELILKTGTSQKNSILADNSTPELKKETNTIQQPEQPVLSLTSGEEPVNGDEILVTATAYTAYCEGCSGTTAYGIDLRSNPNQKVIAVDPNVIPLGTKVWVEGYGEAIAGDTGGAIKGNKIDVFIPSKKQAMQWGRKKVKVKILN